MYHLYYSMIKAPVAHHWQAGYAYPDADLVVKSDYPGGRCQLVYLSPETL
jgi:hypothetical protein